MKGRKFILYFDQIPLLILFGERNSIRQIAASRIQRWAYFLSGFYFELIYKKGIGKADVLFRLPLPIDSNSLECVKICDSLDFISFMEANEGFPLEES